MRRYSDVLVCHHSRAMAVYVLSAFIYHRYNVEQKASFCMAKLSRWIKEGPIYAGDAGDHCEHAVCLLSKTSCGCCKSCDVIDSSEGLDLLDAVALPFMTVWKAIHNHATSGWQTSPYPSAWTANLFEDSVAVRIYAKVIQSQDVYYLSCVAGGKLCRGTWQVMRSESASLVLCAFAPGLLILLWLILDGGHAGQVAILVAETGFMVYRLKFFLCSGRYLASFILPCHCPWMQIRVRRDARYFFLKKC